LDVPIGELFQKPVLVPGRILSVERFLHGTQRVLPGPKKGYSKDFPQKKVIDL
jgi:hypothetical protein